MRGSLLKKTFCLLFFCLFFSFAYAQEEQLTVIGESKYFSLYGYQGIDIPELIEKLSFSYSGITSRNLQINPGSPQEVFEKTMDQLFLEVSQILDIHLPRFKGTVKFVPGQSWVSGIFKSYTGSSFSERSFYLYENNTVYISTESLTLGMLGHEIAHAVMSRYFAVPPPAKIQEVLSGYVEYQLRKRQ